MAFSSFIRPSSPEDPSCKGLLQSAMLRTSPMQCFYCFLIRRFTNYTNQTTNMTIQPVASRTRSPHLTLSNQHPHRRKRHSVANSLRWTHVPSRALLLHCGRPVVKTARVLLDRRFAITVLLDRDLKVRRTDLNRLVVRTNRW